MEFTEEQYEFRQVVRDFVARELPPGFARECDDKEQPPIEQYRLLADSGFLGIGIPEEYGGSGGSILDLTILLHELSKGMVSFAAMVYRSAVHGAQSILTYGSEEQRQEFLPRIAAGEILFCLSLTEPEAGSDAANVQLRAVRDGDDYVLNGQKLYNSSAHIADYILLVTRTSTEGRKHQGLSMFIVDTKLPGIDIRRIPTLGERAVGTNEVFYDDVRVPASALIGEENRGWYQLMTNLEKERLSMAAWCVGGAQDVLAQSIAWAKGREQFARPIADFQVIQHMLADMATDCSIGELMLYDLADRITRSVPCAREASMTKMWASEMYSRVSDRGMQIHGGFGYTMASDMQLHLRDSRLMSIGGGSSQIMRNIIAKDLLG
jgi:alkylation response protein AidB-like acyl-CoA dehydrogenase